MIKQPQPPGFKDHSFEFSFKVAADEAMVWQWLNDTRTFTDTQVWPWKVEFYSPEPDKIPNGFYESVLTNHSGPFVNFAGELTTIKENKYRDLQYLYGSYAISFRWIRPYRLEFSTEQTGELTEITGKLSTYVKPYLYNPWNSAQKIFWGRFKRWATRSVRKLNKKQQA
ncbi:hypothetical protein FNH22_07590 [Fulvivirga sp. M361]|uniref:hypothetical protein n=1 Tax=Fulvivirga sp. M361 TaxID=2594266 RepID=UPI00117BDE1F|nr:hypothetical protein [Fulvivirga sp. M361]TRX59907.1 hypothetical protein FNH22_07590 [Fulvivirga sp. M361]